MVQSVTILQERRRHGGVRRAPAGELAARIRPGHDVRVIDVSPHGALVETSCRLSPGRAVDLQLESASARHVTRATVVRCHVGVLSADGVIFRGALAFEQPVPWLAVDEALSGARST